MAAVTARALPNARPAQPSTVSGSAPSSTWFASFAKATGSSSRAAATSSGRLINGPIIGAHSRKGLVQQEKLKGHGCRGRRRRTRAGSCDSASRPGLARARRRTRPGGGPPPRRTGSGRGRRAASRPTAAWTAQARSSKVVLVGAGDPGGEGLAVLALLQPAADDALDVVREVLGRRLETAHLAAETGLLAETAAEADLEAVDGVPARVLRVGELHALEADVAGLRAGARVRAAVDVDRQRRCVRSEQLGDVGEPGLELGDERGAQGL